MCTYLAPKKGTSKVCQYMALFADFFFSRSPYKSSVNLELIVSAVQVHSFILHIYLVPYFLCTYIFLENKQPLFFLPIFITRCTSTTTYFLHGSSIISPLYRYYAGISLSRKIVTARAIAYIPNRGVVVAAFTVVAPR